MSDLAIERLGSTGSRVVMIHGFTQTHESWKPVAMLLAAHRQVLLIDAPHHGASQSIDTNLEGAADLLAKTVAGGVCIGYSMGGRMALLASLRSPDSFAALVLVSATPGIEDPHERELRRLADESLASEIEQIGTPAFIGMWLKQPMFAHLRPTDDDLAARYGNAPESLAQSLRRCGTGTQEPLWTRLAELTIPVLLIAGEDDHKFTEIAHRMHACLPQSRLEIIEGAGHSPHLEQPALTATLIAQWLDEIGQ